MQIRLDFDFDLFRIDIFMKRYHFLERDRLCIKKILDQCKDYVGGAFFYKSFLDEEGLEDIPYERFVVGAVSLGSGMDELEELFLHEQEYFCCYVLECLAQELLTMAYEQMNLYFGNKMGQWIQKFDFLGDIFPLQMTSLIFDMVETKGLEYNSSFVLKPKNTVVFVGELLKQKNVDACNICANCTRVLCLNKRVMLDERKLSEEETIKFESVTDNLKEDVKKALKENVKESIKEDVKDNLKEIEFEKKAVGQANSKRADSGRIGSRKIENMMEYSYGYQRIFKK